MRYERTCGRWKGIRLTFLVGRPTSRKTRQKYSPPVGVSPGGAFVGQHTDIWLGIRFAGAPQFHVSRSGASRSRGLSGEIPQREFGRPWSDLDCMCALSRARADGADVGHRRARLATPGGPTQFRSIRAHRRVLESTCEDGQRSVARFYVRLASPIVRATVDVPNRAQARVQCAP